ncbi:zinc finger CCCH domain-containing protein 19 [Tanacetum coccineum]
MLTIVIMSSETKSFNSYAKAVLGNNSVGVSGNNDACNSGEKTVGVSVSNKANEESSNEALMFISEDDCIDFDDERCVWIDLVGLPLASWALEVYKKLGGRWGCSVFTDMVSDGPMSHGKVCVLTESLHHVLESFKVSLDGGSEHEEPLDVDNCDSVSSKDDNNDSDSSKGEDHIGDSVLNNDGCVKDCMEKNLDDDVEKDIEDCSKNVTEKCGVVNNNMSNNGKARFLRYHFDGDREVVEDLSSLDRSSDKADRLAHHNNGLDDLDISLCNRLFILSIKCRSLGSVKAVVNDSSIVSPSTPPGTDLNLAEESYSSWLDYVGPLITDELDSEKRWSYRDPDGNVQGSFSLVQLRSYLIMARMEKYVAITCH